MAAVHHDEANSLFLQFLVQYASLALIYYDYALTLSDEIRYIWRAKLAPMTFLYALCRYALAANLVFLFVKADIIHSNWKIFVAVLSIMGRAAILTIWTVRTFALWQRNVWILAILVSILITVVITDIIGSTPIGSVTSNRILATSVVVHEWLSMGLTAYRCVENIRFNKGFVHLQHQSIYHEILAQGLLYIGLVSVFTVTAMILQFVAPHSMFQRLLNALTLPVSGILTARFILHMRSLRDQNQLPISHDYNTNVEFASLGSGRPSMQQTPSVPAIVVQLSSPQGAYEGPRRRFEPRGDLGADLNAEASSAAYGTSGGSSRRGLD